MPTEEHILIDINSVLAGHWQQCQALLLESYPGKLDGRAVDPQNLINLLAKLTLANDDKLLDYVESQLDAVECLSPEQYASLKFTDHFFSNYQKNLLLDPIISQQLSVLRPAIAISLLQQQLPWSDQTGIVPLLNTIFFHAIGCQASLGRAAERFSQQLASIIQQAGTLSEKSTALQIFFEKEKARVNKLEQRLYDAELGTLHAKHASQLSAKTLNQFMAGKKLPTVISTFLQGPWRESMRLMIISDGNASENWQKILRLTETLIWSFQPFDNTDTEYRQHVYQSIADISEQLREVAVGLHHSSKLDEELANIEAEHLKILRGMEIEYHPFQLIDNTDPLLSSQVSMSNSLIKSAAAYDEGQWFIERDDGVERRIKLSVKISQAQQLLFTNFLGIKAAQYSFEEFAYRLSSKMITPIKTGDPFKATGEKMLDGLLQRHLQQQQQAASEAAIEKEIIRQQEISRQAARDKALKEAAAHVEAQKTARLKAQQQNEQLRAQQAQQKQLDEVQFQLDKLLVGGIVIFYDENSKGEHCKLAAVIQSSGQHIFVNRQGIKQHALDKPQLTDRLLNNQAKIIDYGSNFDSTLETVVNGLRTRK
ncbi:DUF1631 family protein [Oceanicoccus sp. KOV_DT_Chl]|uniref:DUF1631 family protein n=1 Tax=Oceanicoccus sp. KOV_DT_Chl TaxID=1904639 RepID=UPI000C7C606E|nr:DUF1631 family protein [Oceanicoccus sp. KOV_DT_Chl]